MTRIKEESKIRERQSRQARKVYQKAYGVIPKGIDIHHKNRNRDNNTPENLEALTRSKHIKRHAIEDDLWGWKKYHEGDLLRTLKILELALYKYNNSIF